MGVWRRTKRPPDLPAAVLREIEVGGRALLEYMMARGPEPGDLPILRAYGYRPEAVVQVEQDRLQREERLAVMLRNGSAEDSPSTIRTTSESPVRTTAWPRPIQRRHAAGSRSQIEGET